jgi:hypothetical protein
MLFTPYALTDAVNRDVRNIAGILMVTFSGLSTGGRKFEILARLEDVNCWINGELIQDAFPYLDADQREILKTGIDTQSWDEMFARSEDD